MNRAIVFLNGNLENDYDFIKSSLKSNDRIFCVDGGANHAKKLNLIPELIMGDLDSIETDTLNYFKNIGVKFNIYPVEKDKTDSELMIEYLSNNGYNDIILFCSYGIRLDHIISNINIMDKYTNKETKIKMLNSYSEIFVVKDYKSLENYKNKTVSIISLTEYSEGLTLKGFYYPLNDFKLFRKDSLGISNIIIENNAEINLKQGSLLVCIYNKDY